MNFFGLVNHTMMRISSERSLLYCFVTAWQSSRKRAGSAIGTSPVPRTTTAFRFFEP
jgi:hypothetical protein